MILSWDKPQRKMPVKDWKKISADGAPPGVYSPNMSATDMEKWKAKLIRSKTGPNRVEIRKSTQGTQILIVVTMGGFPRKPSPWNPKTVEKPEFNVKISQNGPSYFTFAQIGELQQAIQEAQDALKKEIK